MQFFKDLMQAEPVYRLFPLKDAVGFTHGGAVELDLSTATTEIDIASTTWINMAGVFMGADVTSSGTIALGTSDYGKVLINPYAVYLAHYEKGGATLIATAMTATLTTATSEAKAGDWLYNNLSGSSAEGQLNYLASTSTTTTMTALATRDPVPGATDTFVHIHGILTGAAAAQFARIDLDATGEDLFSDPTYTGVGIQILDNLIKSNGISLQPLRVAQHDNLQDTSIDVYGEVLFVDNIWTKI